VIELTYLQAVVLGIVQGLTEFLPISSSGHLALLQRWMQLNADSPAMIMFDLAVHLGTLLAVAAAFRREFVSFLGRLFRELLHPSEKRPAAVLITALGIAASIPTAAIGLFFKDTISAAFNKPVWIGAGLLLTGTLLMLTNLVKEPSVGWRRFGWWRALIIGTAQGIAILPGVSRSGSTIATALLLGVKRRWAGEFSFFIAAPAICGAAVLHAKDVFETSGGVTGNLPIGPLVAGSLFATLTGYAALRWLIAIIRRAQLHYFSYYCWALGLFILLFVR